MTDSHTHLYLREYFDDGGVKATQKAIDAGVDKLVLPNIDMESATDLISLHHAFPLNTFVAAGLHPTEVGTDWKFELREIIDSFSNENIIAIGEIGIDLHWEKENLILQMDAFGAQLDMAMQKDIPVIIHSRDAFGETLDVIRHFQEKSPAMIFHSFSYSKAEAEEILSVIPEAYFGFNGVITFKNAESVREAAGYVGINRILSETDSPFLTPVPFRGRTNESAYIPYIVEAIARSTDTPLQEAIKIIDDTSEKVFKFQTSRV